MTSPATHPLTLRAERLGRLLSRHPVVAALAAAAGSTPVHLVGGLLRDRLLGLSSRDFDAVVAGRGREIAEATAGALDATLVLLGGRQFAAFRVVGDDWVLDLWDREETSLRADLARRDFTVNSFAVTVDDGRVTDPFGGLADLGTRRLRATTRESFSGDPLRVLRLPRLLARLPGFAADPETLALARAAAPGLTGVASERVREELALIFKSGEAARALALMAAIDVYPGLWQGMPGSAGEGAGDRAADSARAIAELAALRGAMAELRTADPAAAGAVDPLTARLAATFARLPAGDRGAGASAARFAEAGYLTRRVADRVTRVLAERELPADETAQRRFLHRLGELWPTAAARLGAALPADPQAREGWRRRLKELVDLVKRDGPWIFDPPRLVDGQEVQRRLGVGPGPRVGQALTALRTAQVEGRVRTREEALELLEKQR